MGETTITKANYVRPKTGSRLEAQTIDFAIGLLLCLGLVYLLEMRSESNGVGYFYPSYIEKCDRFFEINAEYASKDSRLAIYWRIRS
jgi:hypothetical protein